MVASGFDDLNRSIYHVRTLTKVFIEFGGCTLGLKSLKLYMVPWWHITTWWALYMVASGFDDLNRAIYHLRTLTKVFSEFEGCTLGIKSLKPYMVPYGGKIPHGGPCTWWQVVFMILIGSYIMREH